MLNPTDPASETHNYYQRLLKERLSEDPSAVPAIEYKANIRYLVMTSAAEHWIPFITVHLENDIREVQLQRAAMPRILEGDPPDKRPEKVRPQMVLMQSG